MYSSHTLSLSSYSHEFLPSAQLSCCDVIPYLTGREWMKREIGWRERLDEERNWMWSSNKDLKCLFSSLSLSHSFTLRFPLILSLSFSIIMVCKYGKKRKEVLLDRWRSHHIIGKRRTRRNHILLVARMNVFSPLRHCRDSDHRFFLLFAPITPPFSTKEERSMLSSPPLDTCDLREIKVWKEQEKNGKRKEGSARVWIKRMSTQVNWRKGKKRNKNGSHFESNNPGKCVYEQKWTDETHRH